MKLAGCFNGTKTSYVPKDQGKFEFSCHDFFNCELAKNSYYLFIFFCDK